MSTDTANQPNEKAKDPLYHERFRPQFHFTAKKNWLNDPNGLVYYSGEFHLFFQHNPTGRDWGNMHWGHAVSTDLLHWEELPIAITPDKHGPVYSGSCVIDWRNTGSFQQGEEKTMVAFYTGAGDPPVQCLAYSLDRGRTFQKYPGNPIVPHIGPENRDPKVFWHEPTGCWMMVLYWKKEGVDGIEFLRSANLKQWQQMQFVPGFYECPDLFELPVDGDASHRLWVLTAANSAYQLGDFDGEKFHPIGEKIPGDRGANFYAAQSYSDIPIPDSRRIQIGWMNGGSYPDMPFNQQMSFPRELILKKLSGEIRLCASPIREISQLYGRSFELPERTNHQDTLSTASLPGFPCYDLKLEIKPESSGSFGFSIYGHEFKLIEQGKKLRGFDRELSLSSPDETVRLRLLVDLTSVELFADEGSIVLSNCFLPKEGQPPLSLSVGDGSGQIQHLELHELKSIWG